MWSIRLQEIFDAFELYLVLIHKYLYKYKSILGTEI